MVAPSPRRPAVPQAAALISATLLALMTMVGFLERTPTVGTWLVAGAFIVLSAVAGWWPVPAGVGMGLLLACMIAFPSTDSFAVFGVLIPITVLGLSHSHRIRAVLALWFFAGLVALTVLRHPKADSLSEDLSSVLFFAVLIVAAWFLGSALNALVRLHEHEARSAVRGVQVTVAQELHDTVAHSLSLIAMRADQARLAGQGTPEDLRFIAAQSRQAIQDLRGMLETLRRHPEIATGPESNPWQVDPLRLTLKQRCEDLEKLGFSVSSAIEGDLERLPVSADRTLSKVLREALSNVEKHAAPNTPCSVLLAVTDSTAELAVVSTVTDGPSSTPSTAVKLGVIGMRERLEACHGTLNVGRVGARWIMEATIPLGAAVVGKVDVVT